MNVEHNQTDRQFNELWQKYEPYIRNLCAYKLSSMPGCIDDCVQEVFLALLRQLGSGTRIDNPKAWLSTVANNKIIDIYKNEKRHADNIVSISDAEKLSVLFNTAAIEQPQLSDEEIISLKPRVLALLSEKEQLLLEERFVKKMKTAEIARLHGITDFNVRTQLFRLRKKCGELVKISIEQLIAQK